METAWKNILSPLKQFQKIFPCGKFVPPNLATCLSTYVVKDDEFIAAHEDDEAQIQSMNSLEKGAKKNTNEDDR